MCYNYSKYYVEEKYVSNDNGATFVPTGETRRGQLIEQNTQDCGYIEPQTRWTTVQDEYVCQGADKYTKEVQEVSYDGGETWNTNGQERGGTLIQRNSIDCGWIPAPQFRWVDDGYDCVGFDKYEQEKEQVSLDAGETWSDTGQTRLGQLIEYDSEDCGYTPPAPGPEDYLTFTALENGYFSFTGNDLQYSIDDGENWSTLTSGTDSPTVRANSRILWKATGLTPSQSSPYGIGKFSSTGRFNVSGNIMSLYYGDNFASQTDLTGKNYAFSSLFNSCSNLVSAENLVLSATTLANYCYQQMFDGCTALTTAPALPATTMYNYCYRSMFNGCTSLTSAPQLPATTLADICYYSMFSGCTSLTSAPALPSTTLAYYCYQYMFSRCTSLTTAPVLPATTLVDYCYGHMFYGCSNLNYIKAMFTTTPSTRYTNNWVQGVAASGTFVKNSAAQWDVIGNNGIPSGWTVQNASS